MSEITARPDRAAARHGRRFGVVLAGIGLVAAVGAGAAAADSLGVFRQDNGQVAINPDALQLAYKGKIITQQEAADLIAKGLATFSQNNRELACQGITLLFDTEAELQQYRREYEPRHRAALEAEKTLAAGADPCSVYAGSPRFVTK